MDLGQALVARLQGVSAVSEIVGSKVYWIQRPQRKAGEPLPLPAVVLRHSGAEDVDDLNGDSEMAETRITADCFGATDAEAKQLARQVKAALKPPGLQGDFSFDASEVSGPIDLGEPGVAGWQHRASLDCVIRHGAET
jgi:hypothetical protein